MARRTRKPPKTEERKCKIEASPSRIMRRRQRSQQEDLPLHPDAILCGDLHLREDQPVCRTDDYWKAQWKKVDWLLDLQQKHGCVVLCAGDIFDHWKPSPNLIRKAIERLPFMFVVAGQHDLPQHNRDLLKKSGLGVLIEAGKVELLDATGDTFGFSWGEELLPAPREQQEKDGTPKIAVIHHLVYPGKRPWPGAPETGNASQIFKRLRGYTLILSGDNHDPFTVQQKGYLLVNPGSMMRMTADQVTHKPRVYLWYEEENRVEPAYYPIEKGVVSREHIERKEERDNRMEAFISRLKTEYETDLNFSKNLKRALQRNKVPSEVREICLEVIGE